MTHLCFLEEQLKNNTNDSYRLVGDKANGYIELAYHFLILNNNINNCIFDTKDKKFYKWLNDKLSNNRGDTVDDSDKEKKMHKPLATYLLNNPFFMLHVKTIEAGKSSNLKRGMYEWEHPDMIGVRYASEMYKSAFETMQKNAETLFVFTVILIARFYVL